MIFNTNTSETNAHSQAVFNPADHRDIVGYTIDATTTQVEQAMLSAVDAMPLWQATPPDERAQLLENAADLYEAQFRGEKKTFKAPLNGAIVASNTATLEQHLFFETENNGGTMNLNGLD
ncbi:hypothetical protein ACTFIZ_012338 [Dictyostelium cf. discoideum]